MSAFWSLRDHRHETAAALSDGRGDGVTVSSRRIDAVAALSKSSSSTKTLSQHIARESASFMRQPPLSVVTGSAIIFLEKPTFSIISATSSLVEPQAWMRLRASRVERRSARHAFDAPRRRRQRDVTPLQRRRRDGVNSRLTKGRGVAARGVPTSARDRRPPPRHRRAPKSKRTPQADGSLKM